MKDSTLFMGLGVVVFIIAGVAMLDGADASTAIILGTVYAIGARILRALGK